jgi:hypothetical protein
MRPEELTRLSRQIRTTRVIQNAMVQRQNPKAVFSRLVCKAKLRPHAADGEHGHQLRKMVADLLNTSSKTNDKG